MVALEAIAAGERLLEERPFLLSSTGVEHRWADRWQGLTLVHCSAQLKHFLCYTLGGFSDMNGSS
jgi:hypothetical protein